MTDKEYILLKNSILKLKDEKEKEKILKEIKQYNKELIKNYPFLMPYRVVTGEPLENYDYEFTWLDDMEDGWRIAFGIQMMEELKEALIKINFLDKYKLMQVKEKYGSLRWYDNGHSNEMNNIIAKYEDLSERTCGFCGEKAEFISKGWIYPYCKKCANEFIENSIKRHGNKDTFEDEFKNNFNKIEEVYY